MTKRERDKLIREIGEEAAVFVGFYLGTNHSNEGSYDSWVRLKALVAQLPPAGKEPGWA